MDMKLHNKHTSDAHKLLSDSLNRRGFKMGVKHHTPYKLVKDIG